MTAAGRNAPRTSRARRTGLTFWSLFTLRARLTHWSPFTLRARLTRWTLFASGARLTRGSIIPRLARWSFGSGWALRTGFTLGTHGSLNGDGLRTLAGIPGLTLIGRLRGCVIFAGHSDGRE